jgi:hypothetical protein
LLVSQNKRGEKIKISIGREKQQQQQYDTSYKENSALANPYAMFLYGLNSPVIRERYFVVYS